MSYELGLSACFGSENIQNAKMLRISTLILVVVQCVLNNAQFIPKIDVSAPSFDNLGIIYSTEAPKAGEFLRVTCTVVNLNKDDSRSVKWILKRPNELEFAIAVDAVALQFQRPKQRLFAIHETGSRLWALEFRPLERNDFGNISCELSNTHPNVVRVTRFLSIHTEPIILESSTRDVTANIGDNFTLDCFANAYPPPRFQWVQTFETGTFGNSITDAELIQRWRPFLRNWEALISEGPTLKVYNVSRKHRGTYMCSAKNGIGMGDFWTVQVKVNFLPSVTCSPEKVGQAQQMNADAYLECIVEAYPPATLRWFRYWKETGEKRHITDNPDYRIETSGLKDSVVSRLTVVNVLAGDYGEFHLTAINDYGEGVGKVTLFETPEIQIGPGAPQIRYIPRAASSAYRLEGMTSSILVLLITFYFAF